MRLLELTKNNGLPILINIDQIVSIDRRSKEADYTLISCTDNDIWRVEESYKEIKVKLRQYLIYNGTKWGEEIK